MVAIVGAATALRPNLRILLVKTSSLGDVVHNLPVVSDLRMHFPDAQIDWLVEEGFAAIPHLHPGVDTVLPVAIRRWRKHLLQAGTWREMGALRRMLRQANYDMVLDSQGLLKSAWLATWAQGEHHGYAADSIREPIAACLYDNRHHVSKHLHAVERNRLLAAAALAYAVPEHLNYGITQPPLTPALTNGNPLWDSLKGRGSEYAVLLTATSRADKLWPNPHWITLGQQLAARGIQSILPGGSQAEQARAAEIARAINANANAPQAIAAAPADIPTLAGLMAGAQVVVGVDTGLTHLAAALGRPTVAIYCATDPGLTGVLAPQPVVNLGGINQAPAVAQVMQHVAAYLP